MDAIAQLAHAFEQMGEEDQKMMLEQMTPEQKEHLLEHLKDKQQQEYGNEDDEEADGQMAANENELTDTQLMHLLQN